MAQRQIKTTVAGEVIRFAFEGAESLTVDAQQLVAEVRNRAMVFGLIQTISDAAALGKGATVEQKRAAMAKRIETLTSGKWAAERVAPVAFNVGDVVLALARTKTNGDVDRANRAIDAYAAKHGIGREDAAKLFRADPIVGAEYDRILRDRKPAAFDADEALLEMETEPAEEVEEPETVE